MEGNIDIDFDAERKFSVQGGQREVRAQDQHKAALLRRTEFVLFVIHEACQIILEFTGDKAYATLLHTANPKPLWFYQQRFWGKHC